MSAAGDDHAVEEETVRRELERRIALSANLMALISFGSIFYFKFDIREKIGLDDISIFSLPEVWGVVTGPDFLGDVAGLLVEDGLAIALFIFTMIWYYWYLGSVRKELPIIASLFSRLNPPRDYKALQGGGSISLLAVGFTVAFILLALLADQFAFYCLVILALNLLDFRGNALIRRNLLAFFADPALAPRRGARETPFVEARRAVAERYWIERWQLERIMIMAFVNVAALVIYLAPTLAPGLARLAPEGWVAWSAHALATILVIGGIVWNRWVLAGWRRERDADLADIARRERETVYG